MAEVRARLAAAADGVPRCDCGEPLKPDVVLFGEFPPEGALEQPTPWPRTPTCCCASAPSLEVHPIAQLSSITRQCGGAVVLVTQGRRRDERAVMKLDADVEAELQAVVAALGLEG